MSVNKVISELALSTNKCTICLFLKIFLIGWPVFSDALRHGALCKSSELCCKVLPGPLSGCTYRLASAHWVTSSELWLDLHQADVYILEQRWLHGPDAHLLLRLQLGVSLFVSCACVKSFETLDSCSWFVTGKNGQIHHHRRHHRNANFIRKMFTRWILTVLLYKVFRNQTVFSFVHISCKFLVLKRHTTIPLLWLEHVINKIKKQ